MSLLKMHFLTAHWTNYLLEMILWWSTLELVVPALDFYFSDCWHMTYLISLVRLQAFCIVPHIIETTFNIETFCFMTIKYCCTNYIFSHLQILIFYLFPICQLEFLRSGEGAYTVAQYVILQPCNWLCDNWFYIVAISSVPLTHFMAKEAKK